METKKNIGPFNIVFLMTAGALLAWSLVSGIVSTTVFDQNHIVSLIRMFCIVGVLGFIFSRKYYIWISIVLCAGALVVLAFGFFSTTTEPNLATEAAEFIRGMSGFVLGYEDHTMEYERAIIWALNISIGLLVVYFGHAHSHFVLLFLFSAVIVGFTIISPFFSSPLSFYVFVFSILAFLIKHLSRGRRSAAKTGGRSALPMYALPLAIICVGLAALFPPLSAETADTIWHSPAMRPVREINDRIYSGFGPDYFSLAQTGFSGADHRRLGGNITQDHRMVLRLQSDSPQPIYLTGAILDTYTGYAWVNTLNEREPLDFGHIQQNLALYERATSDAARRLLLGERYDTPAEYIAYAVSVTWEVTLSDEDLEMRYVLEAGTTEEEDGRSWWNFIYERAEPDISAAIDYLAESFGVPAGNIHPVRQGMTSSDDWRWVELEVHFNVIVPTGAGSGWLPGVIIDDLEMRNAVIGILNNRTHSVFSPDIVGDIFAHPTGMAFLQEESGRILTEERMPRNNWYTIQYHPAPAQSTASSEGMLQHSYRGVLRDISEMLGGDRHSTTTIHTHDGGMVFYNHYTHSGFTIVRQNWRTISYMELLNSYLIPRADWIYETYTALPTDFPARVRELAHAVTADADSDYMRARMLEHFLRSEFPYTLTPGTPPRNMDFVEYFLFYGQAGYCTYFATAFVTMARSIGLPTRYVEGFMVTGTPDQYGFFSVLNSMGHAWGEVYFEGFGWHRFEPTPGYGSVTTPHLPHRPPGQPVMGVPDFQPPLGEMDDLLGQDRPAAPPTVPSAPNQGTQGGGIPDAPEQSRNWLPILLTVLLPFAVLGCRAFWVYSQEARARRKGNRAAVVYYYGVMLKYLNFFEFKTRKTETPLQFSQRVAEEFGFPNESFFPVEVAVIFGKARYGDSAISLEERRQIEDEAHHLAASIESYTGRVKYLFYKYILAIV